MRFILAICVILSLFMLFSSVTLAADFTKNFLIYYKFDKDNGDKATDSSGNDNDGTMKNGVEIVKGKFGKCAEFPGGTGHIETVIDVPENNFTMALWLKTDNPGVGVYSVLDGDAGAGGHDRHFYLQGGNICRHFTCSNGPQRGIVVCLNYAGM